MRGAALAEAEEQLKKRPEDLIDEQEFIEQSIAEGNRLKQIEAARRKREIRTAWGIAAGSIVAMIISSGLGWIAWNKTKEAELNQADSLGRYSQSLFSAGKDLDAFVQAIKAGRIVQKQHATNLEVVNALQEGIARGSERNRLEGHHGSVDSVSFSPDSRTLFSDSADKTMKIWNVETGKEIRSLQDHDGSVSSVNFGPGPYGSFSWSADGKTLAFGGLDGTIKIWNVEIGKEIRSLKIRSLNGYESSVWQISLSPGGKILASTSQFDSTIKIWNIETGKEIRSLQAHHGMPISLSWNTDGKTLASSDDSFDSFGGFDGTIKIWNVETGKEIRSLNGSASNVSFRPNGKTLAFSSGDNIKLWNVETLDFLMVQSCDWVRNYLTYNPNVSESDRHLCDGIGTRK